MSNENGVGPEDWYIPEPQPAGKPALVRRKWFMASGIGVIAIVGLTTVLVVSQTGASASSRVDASTAAKAGTILKKAKPAGFHPAASTPAAAAQQMGQAFLTAWQSGNLKLAASYTDDPAAAQSVLGSYGSGLHLSALRLKAQPATAAGLVGFSVSASVGTGGSSTAASATSATGTWSYTSHLTAYQSAGGWYVKWDPSLVAPNVSATVHPVAVAIKPGPAKVTDASGNSLSSSSQVALQNIAATMEQSVKTTQGKAGLARTPPATSSPDRPTSSRSRSTRT
jgi:NTF2-like N-terminal transpeptidase domain